MPPLTVTRRLPGLRLYWGALLILFLTWSLGMTWASGWSWFREHWQMSLTMVFGSFVAGSTPAGGASVAFPVFTKVLAIESQAAATFGLMIQSVGMSMASIFILARGIPIYTNVIRWGALGGSVGVLLGLAFVYVPAPYPKLLFSCLVFSFAIALWVTRNGQSLGEARKLTRVDHWRFLLTGVIGGVLASQTGSGADMLIFMVMMMAYRLEGKRAIPSSVCIMAIVSLVGSAGLLVLPQRAIGPVWEYWAVCVPVVAVGAPLGAYVISRVSPRVVMIAVLLLITVEVVSTFLVIPMTPARVCFAVTILVLAGLTQWRLHRHALTLPHVS